MRVLLRSAKFLRKERKAEKNKERRNTGFILFLAFFFFALLIRKETFSSMQRKFEKQLLRSFEFVSSRLRTV